jgi:hypothetical protein
MKKTPTSLVSAATVAAVLGLSVFVSACSKTNDANSTAGTAASSTPAVSDAGTVAATAATDSWDNLKNYSYDQRSEFAAKANEFANTLDERIQSAKGETSTRLAEARDDLRTAANEVSNATQDTWEATKERVGRAWQKAESAAQSVAE